MSKQMIVSCFISVLAGSGVGIGIAATVSNVHQNQELSTLEERVEELEKAAKTLDEFDTDQWGEIRENSIYLDELRDEVKEAGLSTLVASKREYWESKGVYDPAVAEREDFFCGSLVARSCWKSDECTGEDNQWECHKELFGAFRCLERETWCLGSEKYDEYAAGECINSIMGSSCEEWNKRLVATKECAKVCTKPNGMRAWWNAPVFEEVLR